MLVRALTIGLIVFCFAGSLTAQLRFGVKGGLSTYDLGVNDALNITTGSNTFQLNVDDSKYGYHLGIVLQGRIGNFIIQPEVVFNSNTVDFSLDQLPNGSQILTERYQNLDIPFLLGLSAGPMRLMAGAVGHYFLKSTSELSDIETYQQKFDDLTYGWQAGIGVDVLNLMLDIRYEGNFSKFGDHIVFAGESYAFDHAPTRLLASLAITINK